MKKLATAYTIFIRTYILHKEKSFESTDIDEKQNV